MPLKTHGKLLVDGPIPDEVPDVYRQAQIKEIYMMPPLHVVFDRTGHDPGDEDRGKS